MTERRYGEGEVRRIFELATRPGAAGPPAPTASKGMTLEEIQSIGVEVGVDPAVVARAAAALDTRGAGAARKALGMPIEVGRIVPLPRALTDHEWDQLVAELRTTFRAQGRVTAQGGLREWSNGNLHACVEPTASGYRLRLGTMKGDAMGVAALGATGLAAGALVAGSLLLSGGLQEAFFVPILFGASGVGALLANMLRLPRWAEQREQQMEHIGARVGTIVDASPKANDEP